MTYGDGVADVDIGALLDFHRASGDARHGHRGAARRDASARWSSTASRSTRLRRRSRRRRRLDQRRLLRAVARRSSTTSTDDDTVWEREPLERLARDGQLAAYRHDGFWQPMDTLRDKLLQLEELWDAGTRAVEDVVT